MLRTLSFLCLLLVAPVVAAAQAAPEGSPHSKDVRSENATGADAHYGTRYRTRYGTRYGTRFRKRPPKKPAKAPRRPIKPFIALDAHLANVGMTSQHLKVTVGVGVSLDTSLGRYFLSHVKLLGTYLNMVGLKADLGLGIVFYGYSGRTSYSQVWSSRSGGTLRYGSYSSTCSYNIIHSIDFGARQYALWNKSASNSRWYQDSSTMFDTVGYFGYRFDYVLNKIATVNAVTVSVHGMAGYVNRHKQINDVNGDTDADDVFRRFAWGVKARLKWWMFDFEGGYFDNAFYMEFSLIIPFSFFL